MSIKTEIAFNTLPKLSYKIQINNINNEEYTSNTQITNSTEELKELLEIIKEINLAIDIVKKEHQEKNISLSNELILSLTLIKIKQEAKKKQTENKKLENTKEKSLHEIKEVETQITKALEDIQKSLL